MDLHKNKSSLISSFIGILLIQVITGLVGPQESIADKVYWTNMVPGNIQRSNSDGTNIEDIITVGVPNSISIDPIGGKMYWFDQSGAGLLRSNLDGSLAETIMLSSIAIGDIAIDTKNAKIYWTDKHGHIKRANLDGSIVEDIISPIEVGINAPIALDREAEKIYWGNYKRIQRSNLDGSNIEDLIHTNINPTGIALDTISGKIYWITDCIDTKGGIWHANLDGSEVESLYTFPFAGYSYRTRSIEIDFTAEKMYWSYAGEIQRANLDGSGVESIVTGIGWRSHDVALLDFTIINSISSAIIGKDLHHQLKAEGGVAPFSWSIADGELPDGIFLSSDGLLTGIPKELGESTFTLCVTDATGDIAERAITLSIVFVSPLPDIRINKTGTLAVPGRTMDYWILVENQGSLISSELEIMELLHPSSFFQYISADPTPVMYDDELLLWDIGNLKPGQADILHYKVVLDPNIPLGTAVPGASKPIKKGTSPEEMKQLLDYQSQLDCVDPACMWALYAYCVDPGPACTISIGECLSCIQAMEECTKNCDPGNKFSDDWEVHRSIAVGPKDPNEKGSIVQQYIQPDQILVYPIHFKNIGDIEALDVFITDVLDSNLDESTLKFITPDGASFDQNTRTVHWDLYGRNLQPGETDNVLLSIRPKQGLPSGTEIRNSALIQFEVFDPLVTNEVVNIIDSTAPTCVMTPMPAEISTTEFEISWSGSDAIGEIDTYSVFISKNGGPLEPFLYKTSDTSATFTGEVGSKYGFICVAVDTTGNVEAQEAVPDVTTSIVSNQPPVAQCQNVTASTEPGLCTAAASIDAGSFDPDGDPITLEQAPIGPYALGITDVTLTITDNQGASNTCTAAVSVQDTTPPEITLTVSPDTLWPPNHKMVSIEPTITATDNCDANPQTKLVSITMNEGEETNTYDPAYDDSLGDGNTNDDIQLDENGNMFLRAERSGKSTGRIYFLTYEAKDSTDNISTATATVTVPHDMN